jgi:HAD superfamily hydrolase (TIGR01509 family)
VREENPKAGAKLPPFSAILFDMDGLVLDSEKTYVTAWQRAAKELGKTLQTEVAEGLFGRHADDVARLLGEALGPDFDRRAFFEVAERHWFDVLEREGIQGMPGIEPLLAYLKSSRIPYALATNSDARYAERCLAVAGLAEAFEVFVSRDQVQAGKPAPDLFLAAAEQLRIAPSACLVLEDSETGLMAARAAGTHPILIQHRPVLRDKLSTLADRTFPDLVAFLSALNPRLP